MMKLDYLQVLDLVCPTRQPEALRKVSDVLSPFVRGAAWDAITIGDHSASTESAAWSALQPITRRYTDAS